MPATAEEGARQAVEALVDAFGAHDSERYFAAFAPNARFIFYNVPRVLASRAEYEQLWRSWEADGFHVLSCVSSDSVLQMLGDRAAVFTHSVTTQLADAKQKLHERETIVLHRGPDDRWLAVHEHLSPLPEAGS